jgi:hypothetical protein
VKKKLMISVAALAALCLTFGCKAESPKTAQVSAPAASKAPAGMRDLPPPQGAGLQGPVVDTVNAAGYTYVQVDTGAETVWAATNAFEVKVGDNVTIPQGIPMRNYHSKTLDRTFDLVYFVGRIVVGTTGAAAAPAPQGHPPMGENRTKAAAPAPQGRPPMGESRTKAATPADIDFSGLQKPEGAKTVAELFAGRKELAGKTVTVHGKVVKFSPEILGTNWIHIQDGTGEEGTNDLVVTSKDRAQVGDTVTMTGLVKEDSDFGFGYRYELVLSDAKLAAE